MPIKHYSNKKYTVVGFYLDNDQPYVGHVMASDPSLAVAVVRDEVESEIAVVEVFEGHRKGVLGNDEIFR